MIAKIIRPDTELTQYVDCDNLSHNIISNQLSVSFSRKGQFIFEESYDHQLKIYLMDNGKTIDTIHFAPKPKHIIMEVGTSENPTISGICTIGKPETYATGNNGVGSNITYNNNTTPALEIKSKTGKTLFKVEEPEA